MIHSFGDQFTEDTFHGIHAHPLPKNFSSDLLKVAKRKLDVLNAADSLETLMALPNNRDARAGRDSGGKLSIPLDNNWCIAFRWGKHDMEDVEIKIA